MLDTTPYRAMPFQDSIAGGIVRVLPCFIRHRTRTAEIPLRGGSAPQIRNARARGIAPCFPSMKASQNPDKMKGAPTTVILEDRNLLKLRSLDSSI